MSIDTEKNKSGFGSFLSSIGSAFTGDPFGALSSIGSLVGAFSQIGAGKREEKRQKRLMDYQDAIADENYAKELADQERLIAEDREYNSIRSQVSRAREGGVSPLAALGVSSGNSVSAQSPSQGSPSIPSGGLADSFSQFGEQFSQSMQSISSIKLQQEQMKLIREQQATEMVERLGKEIDNAISIMERDGWSEKRQKELDALTSEYEENMTRAGYNNELIATERSTRQEKINEIRARVRNLDSGTSLNIAKTLTEDVMRSVNKRLADTKVRLNENEFYKISSETRKINQEISNLIENEYLTFATRQKVEQEIDNLKVEFDKTKAEIDNINADTNLKEVQKVDEIASVVERFARSASHVNDIFDTWLNNPESKSPDAKDLEKGAEIGKRVLLKYGIEALK